VSRKVTLKEQQTTLQATLVLFRCRQFEKLSLLCFGFFSEADTQPWPHF
jgi:hypothetical protein